MKNEIRSTAEILRQKAEALLNDSAPPTVPSTGQPVQITETDYLKLIHELEVHQVELEMQNEELLRTKSSAQHAAEKYTELFDFAPSGYFTLNNNGEITEMNLSGSQMLGKGRSHLINSKFALFISSDTKSIFNLFLQNVFCNKNKEICDLKLIVNDTLPRYVHLTGIVSEKGGQCFVTVVDISDRKLAELALQESEEQFRAVSEYSFTSICIINELGKILWANDAMVKMGGYSLEEIYAAETFLLFLAPESAEFVVTNFMQFVKGEKYVHHYEFSFIRADGEKRLCEKYMSHYKDRRNNTNLVISISDITERKRVEEDMRRANSFLDSIVEHIPNMVFIKDVPLLRFVRFNKAGEDLLGMTREEMVGKNDHDFFSEEQADFFIAQDREVLHSKIMKEIAEEQVQTKLLGVRVLHTRKVPILNALGEPEYLLGISEDITERKLAEQELIKAKEKAEESDRLKSAFLTNMSHEIRTPMNGILGFTGLLKEPGLTGEDQQEYIRIIEKSGARLLNIINDIVDLSKIESGQMKTTISETNINMQIQYIYSFFKPEAEQKGIRFSLKNSLPAKDTVINTDREKLATSLSNMVKNAIKFTDKGSIEFGCGPSSSTTAPTELTFFVKDTGIGIPKDRQEAVFDRFVQADIDDKRAFQGAGLGLSISKAYIEMLGGKIWVDSEEGKGSVFYFTIPYSAEPNGNSAPVEVVSPEDNRTNIKPLKILIAEDDEPSELLISAAIKIFCKELIKVRSGAEAVEACRNNPDFDLVLMDIKMPAMDGYEATRQIRQFNKNVVIIAQTAFGLSGDRGKAMAAGCNDYISKPLSISLLRRLIQQHLGFKF